MVLFGIRETAERAAAGRICLALCQYFIGVVSPSLSLPIAFQDFKDSPAFAGLARKGTRGVGAHVEISHALAPFFALGVTPVAK
jgi:hypothetical protein